MVDIPDGIASQGFTIKTIVKNKKYSRHGEHSEGKSCHEFKITKHQEKIRRIKKHPPKEANALDFSSFSMLLKYLNFLLIFLRLSIVRKLPPMRQLHWQFLNISKFRLIVLDFLKFDPRALGGTLLPMRQIHWNSPIFAQGAVVSLNVS